MQHDVQELSRVVSHVVGRKGEFYPVRIYIISLITGFIFV